VSDGTYLLLAAVLSVLGLIISGVSIGLSLATMRDARRRLEGRDL
jgi:hypothetical protein